MTLTTPSAGYSLSLRVRLASTPGALGALTTAIGEAGGDIDAIELVEHRPDGVVREIVVKCGDELHCHLISEAARQVPGVSVEGISDRTLDLHRGGKVQVVPKSPLLTSDDLAMAYTPGVGRVCSLIAEQPELAWDFTMKGNSVAVLTDGSAVLGLGALGPQAALPVMEGKAVLFKQLAGIDAFPLCVATSGDPQRFIDVALGIAPNFGGINLEDIAAPACFEIEERLEAELDIPVFHDDQHGTAIATLAALLNAARVICRPLPELRVVILGMGAAGLASAELLLAAGVGDVVGVDRGGVLSPTNRDLSPRQRSFAERSNREGVTGGAPEALRGADVFIGLSAANAVKPEWLAAMARQAAVFALANPRPEVMPELVPSNVAVMATGRSDYPNQVNNALVFPGLFRGLLDGRSRRVTTEVKLRAAQAIAGLVRPEELHPGHIVPALFDLRVVPAVAGAVRQASTISSQGQL